jgi:phospholipid transport system substrate-binding protein
MMHSMKVRSILYPIIALIAFSVSTAFAAPSDPKEFIKTLGKEAIDTLTDPNKPDSEIESQFANLLDRDFAVMEIAKFVLGKYNRGASDEQKEKFKNIFRDRLKKSYASRFKQYRGVKFTVKSASPAGDSRSEVKSTMQEAKPNAPLVSVEWKLKKLNGEWKIFDVLIDGVSMATTLRSEYASAITQKGSLEQFIASKKQ